MKNSATKSRIVASTAKGLIFAALVVPLGLASVPAFAGANIQMLPPVTEGTTTACPPGTAHMLTWDGANPLSCSNELTVTGGNIGVGIGTTAVPNALLQVGTNNSGTTRQLTLGTWADASASATGWGLFGGNMYLQEETRNFTYSNTHNSIGAVGFATNYPGWNQASVITSGTTSATAGNTFTPASIATFQYDGKVGIGSSAPNSSLDLSQKTDAVSMPSGSTGQEPGSPVKGMTRYNTDTNKLEYWNGSAWVTVSPQIEIGSWTGNVNDGGYYGSTHCMGMSFTPGYSLSQIRAVGTIYYPANGSWDWSAWSLFFIFDQASGQPDNGQGTVCIDSGGNWHGVVHSEYLSWTVFVQQ